MAEKKLKKIFVVHNKFISVSRIIFSVFRFCPACLCPVFPVSVRLYFIQDLMPFLLLLSLLLLFLLLFRLFTLGTGNFTVQCQCTEFRLAFTQSHTFCTHTFTQTHRHTRVQWFSLTSTEYTMYFFGKEWVCQMEKLGTVDLTRLGLTKLGLTKLRLTRLGLLWLDKVWLGLAGLVFVSFCCLFDYNLVPLHSFKSDWYWSMSFYFRFVPLIVLFVNDWLWTKYSHSYFFPKLLLAQKKNFGSLNSKFVIWKSAFQNNSVF